MTHEELRGLIPLMALHSLPSSEEFELIAHLKVCRDCSELLESHQQTAGSLGLWAPAVEAPLALRERILRQAAETPQFVPERVPDNVRSIRSGKIRMRVAAGLAAAAVVVFGAVGAQQVLQKNSEIEQQRDLLAEQRKALDLASADSSLVIPMDTTSPFTQVEGKVVVSDSTGRAAVLMTGLKDPGNKVYTLWLMPADGERQNLADFAPDDSGLAVVNLERGVEERDTLAVTLEPRPKNAAPTGPVVGSAQREANVLS